MKKFILTFLVSLLIVASFSYSSFAQQRGMPPAVVEVGTVSEENLAPSIDIPANVVSKSHGWLSAETTGRIRSIVERGENVKKGDVLAVVNTTTLRSMRREQQSNVKSETAQISYLRNQVKRLNELRAQNIAAVSQLEQTQANLDAAISGKAAAEARLEQINIGIAASSIRAQFSGTVTERQVQMGEHVTPGRQVIRVVDLNNKEIIARTTISNVQNLSIGDSIRLNNLKDSFSAKVTSLVPFGDITEGVYEIRLNPEEKNTLRVGESVRLNIPQSSGQTVMTVPRDAILLRSSGSTVVRVNDDNTTDRISVITGIGNNDTIAITDTSGQLKLGDKVIIRGAERLRPGQPIQVKSE